VPAAEEFFDDRREWSRWKHDILRRYLPKFSGILGSQHATVSYVDAFAGAGTYGPESPVPGSPLIAAELAASIEESKKWPYRLRCMNVEPNRENFRRLCAATANYPADRVTNLHGTFRDRLEQVLELVGTSPTLFFLDPFGYKGMEWATITRLVDRAGRAKTELLVNFNVGKVDRDAGWLDSYDQPAAPAFVEGLNELMGTEEWQEVYDDKAPKEQRDSALTNFYLHRLASAFRGYASAYPVRTLAGRLKYYLLHTTKHPRGRREMGDVLFRVEAAYQTERALREQEKWKASLFPSLEPHRPPQKQIDAEIAARLQDDVYAVGKRRGLITFGRLQDELAGTWFGRAVERHYRAACKLLIQQGKIKRDKTTGITDDTVLRFN
jgi:three-Cys-motif partner protein